MDANLSGEKLVRKHPTPEFARLAARGIELWYSLEPQETITHLHVTAKKDDAIVGRATYWFFDRRLYLQETHVEHGYDRPEIAEALHLFSERFFDAALENLWEHESIEEDSVWLRPHTKHSLGTFFKSLIGA